MLRRGRPRSRPRDCGSAVTAWGYQGRMRRTSLRVTAGRCRRVRVVGSLLQQRGDRLAHDRREGRDPGVGAATGSVPNEVRVAQDQAVAGPVGEQVKAVAPQETVAGVPVLGVHQVPAVLQRKALGALGDEALARAGLLVGLDPDAHHRARAHPGQGPGVEHRRLAVRRQRGEATVEFVVDGVASPGGLDLVVAVEPDLLAGRVDVEDAQQRLGCRHVRVAELFGQEPGVGGLASGRQACERHIDAGNATGEPRPVRAVHDRHPSTSSWRRSAGPGHRSCRNSQRSAKVEAGQAAEALSVPPALRCESAGNRIPLAGPGLPGLPQDTSTLRSAPRPPPRVVRGCAWISVDCERDRAQWCRTSADRTPVML